MIQEESNKANITGTVSEPFKLSHKSYDSEVYSAILDVKRESGYIDKVPIEVVARYLTKLFEVGTQISVKGEVRTYNCEGHLKIVIFAHQITEVNAEKDINEVEMICYICKPPIFRKTPLGRKICDILVAVPRRNNKSSYVPCITWGKNAKSSQYLQVGEKVKLKGRMQSREYQKKISEEKTVTKTARELSCSSLKVL